MQNGACVPAGGGSASTWPNQFSKAAGGIPRSPRTTTRNAQVVQPIVPRDRLRRRPESTPAHDKALVNRIIAGATEASRMQGFKNRRSRRSCAIRSRSSSTCATGRANGRPAARAGFRYQNSTLYPATASVRASGGPSTTRSSSARASPTCTATRIRAAGPVADAVRAGRPRPRSRAVGRRLRATCRLPHGGGAGVQAALHDGGREDQGVVRTLRGRHGCFDTTVPICGAASASGS